MRAINLAIVLQLALQSEAAPQELLRRLLVLCEMHGRFIFANVEYSDVRGNHFAANIAALAVLANTFAKTIPEAIKWSKYAAKHLESELNSQFSYDGVQFEKSVPYHRLVTQLFLLSAIALEKGESRISENAKKQLHKAEQDDEALMADNLQDVQIQLPKGDLLLFLKFLGYKNFLF